MSDALPTALEVNRLELQDEGRILVLKESDAITITIPESNDHGI